MLEAQRQDLCFSQAVAESDINISSIGEVHKVYRIARAHTNIEEAGRLSTAVNVAYAGVLIAVAELVTSCTFREPFTNQIERILQYEVPCNHCAIRQIDRQPFIIFPNSQYSLGVDGNAYEAFPHARICFHGHIFHSIVLKVHILTSSC